jgi:hypothetical protein
MQRRRWLAFIVVASLMGPSVVAAGEDDPELESLRQLHFCEILGYLKAIRHDRRKSDDRYLIVSVDGERGYVQCLFYDRNHRILCEVASGFYERPGIHYVAPERLPALAALGFSLNDSKGNFQQRRAVKGEAALNEIADLFIRSLREVYGVTAAAHLRYDAPLVAVPPPAQSYLGGQCGALTS